MPCVCLVNMGPTEAKVIAVSTFANQFQKETSGINGSEPVSPVHNAGTGYLWSVENVVIEK